MPKGLMMPLGQEYVHGLIETLYAGSVVEADGYVCS